MLNHLIYQRRAREIDAFERLEIVVVISLLCLSRFLYPFGIEGFRGSKERLENFHISPQQIK